MSRQSFNPMSDTAGSEAAARETGDDMLARETFHRECARPASTLFYRCFCSKVCAQALEVVATPRARRTHNLSHLSQMRKRSPSRWWQVPLLSMESAVMLSGRGKPAWNQTPRQCAGNSQSASEVDEESSVAATRAKRRDMSAHSLSLSFSIRTFAESPFGTARGRNPPRVALRHSLFSRPRAESNCCVEDHPRIRPSGSLSDLLSERSEVRAHCRLAPRPSLPRTRSTSQSLSFALSAAFPFHPSPSHAL